MDTTATGTRLESWRENDRREEWIGAPTGNQTHVFEDKRSPEPDPSERRYSKARRVKQVEPKNVTSSRIAPQHTCLAVSQLNPLANVWIMESVYLPDCLINNIDSISGKETHESASESMESLCPSLTLDLFIALDTLVNRELFTHCDPSVQFPHTPDHHATFLRVVNCITIHYFVLRIA